MLTYVIVLRKSVIGKTFEGEPWLENNYDRPNYTEGTAEN